MVRGYLLNDIFVATARFVFNYIFGLRCNVTI